MNIPIKVIQVLNSLGRGGIESLVCDLYNNIDRNQIQFDFCIAKGKEIDHLDEVKKMGAKVYVYPNLTFKNFIPYLRWWKKFFNEHKEYKIVHAHVFTHASLILKIAKRRNLITIVHSHSSDSKEYNRGILNNFIRKLLLKPLSNAKYIDFRLACSELAGKFTFKDANFTVMKNGIEVDKFIYNENVRNKCRKKLNIQNNFIVGHIGNAVLHKNHIFLMKIFREIADKYPSAKLMLIGSGIKENPDIMQCIKANKIEKQIIFMGVRNDVNELLQAMDIFLMPSLYEGLGIVVIESQAAGLKTVCSDDIPPETNISDLIEYISLNKSAEYWADKVLKYKNGYDRTDRSEDISSAGYNIKNVARDIQNFYLEIYK